MLLVGDYEGDSPLSNIWTYRNFTVSNIEEFALSKAFS